MTGPASSTDNAVTRFDGTTGKVIQNSTATLSDAGDLAATSGTFTGGVSSSTLSVTGNTTFNTVAYGWPGADGSSGQYLSTDGAGALSWSTASGTGDVVGPASATDDALARYDGTTGKLIQNSAATLSDAGKITTPTIEVYGPTTLNGVALTWPGSAGSSGQLLTTNGSGTLSWTDDDTGGDDDAVF